VLCVTAQYLQFFGYQNLCFKFLSGNLSVRKKIPKSANRPSVEVCGPHSTRLSSSTTKQKHGGNISIFEFEAYPSINLIESYLFFGPVGDERVRGKQERNAEADLLLLESRTFMQTTECSSLSSLMFRFASRPTRPPSRPELPLSIHSPASPSRQDKNLALFSCVAPAFYKNILGNLSHILHRG
jgi:hypothetical protein